jgi:gliding motility-associated-like protein
MKTYFILIFCILIIGSAHAQLCQGSLGDPVVKITFGAGPNPGPSLTAATTNYLYVSTDCPQDGYYTVRNQTADCFFDTWNYITADHTGDPQGYFMLINASFQPSDFYLDTIKGLCPGTTYEFAAWITNMLRNYACNGQGIKPNITFSIENPGVGVLGQYNTGDLPPSDQFGALWTQYGLYFTTPPGITNVVVRMTNNAPGGCGNDLAMDDITFRPCGPKIGVSIIGVTTDTANICDGQNNAYTFTGNISAGFNNPVYQWQMSADSGVTWTDIAGQTTTQYIKPQTNAPGEYAYRMASAENGNINNNACRIHSNVIAVNVNPLPQINVSSRYTLCTNDSLVFSATGGQTYNWSGPNNFSSQDSLIIVHNPPTTYSGTYYVQSASDKGCQINDTIIVSVFQAVTANAGKDTTICQGNTIQLTGSGGISCTWAPATGLSSATSFTPLASPADSIMYVLTVKDANNCTVKDSVAINVLKKPVANAGQDKKILEGQSVQLNGSAAGTNVIYTWQPVYNITDATVLQPVVSPAHDTIYTLVVTSLVGCGVATDDVFVRVLETVHLPNAFSPNGDGINDTWNIPKLITYPEADIYVYNRAGQLVYHSKGYNKPWDGTFNGNRLPFGTYYYLIDLKNGLPKLSGWVQILY